MKSARDIQMSVINTPARLDRIGNFSMRYRLTSIDDEVRPFFEFSDQIVFGDIELDKFLERLDVLISRAGDDGLTIAEVEDKMTKFVQTLLLCCAVRFGDEIADVDVDVDMYSLEGEEGVATN